MVKLNYTCWLTSILASLICQLLLKEVEEGEIFRQGDKIKVFCRIGLAKKFIQVFPYHLLKILK